MARTSALSWKEDTHRRSVGDHRHRKSWELTPRRWVPHFPRLAISSQSQATSERPQAISAVLAILAFLAPGSPEEDPSHLQPRETKPGHRGEPRGAHPLPRSRSLPDPGGNLRAASPTAPAAVETRGLPAPASCALFPHVLLAAQNHKLQRRPVRHHGEPPLCPSSRGAAGPPRAQMRPRRPPGRENSNGRYHPRRRGMARRRRARDPAADSVMRPDPQPTTEGLGR